MESRNFPASLEHRLFCLVTTFLLVSAILFTLMDSAIDTVSGSLPFSSDRMVSDPDENADQYYPDVAVSPNGTIYVVWEDSRNDPTPGYPPYVVDVFISESSNGGRSFSGNVQVTDHAQTLVKSEPSIAIDPEGTVFVAWWDNTGLYLQRSLDGVVFTDPVEVSAGISGTFKISPSVCAPAPGRVYVTYASPDGMQGRIFVAISNDGGHNFSSIRADDDDTSFKTNPDIGVDGDGNIYVVWQDERNGDTDIYFSKSTNGGVNFSSDVRVNDDIGNAKQDFPSLAVGKSGSIYIVWRDWRNANSDIFFSKSTDGGETFGDGILNNNDVEVDDYPFQALHDHPVIAIDDSEKVFVSWRDTRNGFSDQDIYFTQSEDGGQTFGDGLQNDNDMKVNDDLEDTDQEIPAIAVGPDGRVCIVWYDNRNFAEKRVDIYFSIMLGSAPDLIISGGSISGGFVEGINFDPPSPQAEGTLVVINATIHNVGSENASDVVVRFYDDLIDPQNQIGGDEVISFLPRNGGNASIYKDWVCQGVGVHTIFVAVDPDDEIMEWNEENNVASSTFEVLSLVNPARPENVSASLLEPLHGDVIVSWTLSLDDNGGRKNVERYDIYRGLDFHPIGLGYQIIGSVPSGTDSFLDENSGHGDPYDYFYIVCAFNTTSGSSCSPTQGGKINTPVTTGWNLLSSPLLLTNSEVELAFRTIDFDIVRKYDSLSSSWKSYFSFKNGNDLRSADVSSGLWVHCLEDGDLTIAGQVPREVDIELHAGWNLIALPSFASAIRLSDLLSMFPIKKAEIFAAHSPPYFLMEMNSFEVFNPKRGYWVETLEEVTIRIYNQ